MKRKYYPGKPVNIKDYLSIDAAPKIADYLTACAEWDLKYCQRFIYEGGNQRSDVLREMTKDAIAFIRVANHVKSITLVVEG